MHYAINEYPSNGLSCPLAFQTTVFWPHDGELKEVESGDGGDEWSNSMFRLRDAVYQRLSFFFWVNYQLVHVPSLHPPPLAFNQLSRPNFRDGSISQQTLFLPSLLL